MEAALRLERAGEPFVLAIVVRVDKPTSAKPGAKAIVTMKGEWIGWIGGSCSLARGRVRGAAGDEDRRAAACVVEFDRDVCQRRGPRHLFGAVYA